MALKSFKNVILCTFLVAAVGAMVSSAYQFNVGEWREPTGREPETYNEWTSRNRFHVGDTIVFKYQNDSVLLVTSADYLNCTTSNPISRFEGGNTIFQLDRPGYFFFISGQPGHCTSGERLIVDVIHSHRAPASEIAPTPVPSGGDGEGSDDSSQPQSSASKLSVFSSIVGTVVAGVLYKFM